MKHVPDTAVLWLLFVVAAASFTLGAVWSSQVQPEVFVVPQQPVLTPATAAPPTVASVQP